MYKIIQSRDSKLAASTLRFDHLASQGNGRTIVLTRPLGRRLRVELSLLSARIVVPEELWRHAQSPFSRPITPANRPPVSLHVPDSCITEVAQSPAGKLPPAGKFWNTWNTLKLELAFMDM
jgi:hypothetical protein